MTEIEAYRKLLSSRPENERYYECVTLSHSDLSKTYYLVADSSPLSAEVDGEGIIEFQPASISISDSALSSDLSQQISFTISDIENVLDDELDRIQDGSQESPLVAYSIYHSEYLDSPVEHIEYSVSSIPQKKGSFTIKAGAPELNVDQTGEIFDFDRFPPLRALL